MLLSKPSLSLFSQSPRNARYQGGHNRHRRPCASSSEQQPEQPSDYRSLTQSLNRLFYSTTAPEQSDVETEAETSQEERDPGAQAVALPSLLHDVPLWRVQWATLPGFQEMYHVHVPHYVDLFERLFAEPRPWRFGHLYLPQGSANLGNPEFELAPGSKAPLVGTMMEVLQVVRFPDGRLLLLTVGVCRFKANGAPPRADVALLPDWEEVQQCQSTALEALEGSRAGRELSVAAAMQASVVAAEQAAAAAAKAWWHYEVSSAADEARKPRQLDITNGTNEEEARAFGKRLVAIAATGPVAALPLHGPGGAEDDWPSSEEEEGEEGEDWAAAEAQPGSVASTLEQQGLGELGGWLGSAVPTGPAQWLQPQQPLPQSSAGVDDCAACAATADAAAQSAAAEALEALAGGRGSASGEGSGSTSGSGSVLLQGPGLGTWTGTADTALQPGHSLSHASAGPLQGVNSTSDRGVPALPAAPLDLALESEGAGAREVPLDGAGASRSVALRLETLAWQELDAVCHLAKRLRQQHKALLGDGLAQLRTPGTTAAVTAAATQRQLGLQDEGSQDMHAVAGRTSDAPPAAAAHVSLHPAYPALRRVQRLSYALASVLSDLSANEGWQALLEAPSISSRLGIALAGLQKHRSMLAAVVAVQGLTGEGGEG